MNIRNALPGDLRRMEELCAASPGASQWVDGFQSLVVHIDRKLVGFAIYRVIAPECELLNLAVDPAYRRRGVARHLLETVTMLSQKIHLEVRESNSGAIACYLAFGFAEVGRRPNYYPDGEAALLFQYQSPQPN